MLCVACVKKKCGTKSKSIQNILTMIVHGNFLLLFMSLLTVFICKNSHKLTIIYFGSLIKRPKSLSIPDVFLRKDQKNGSEVRHILAFFGH